MSEKKRPRVLDEGQCVPDHQRIANLLDVRLEVDVDPAYTADEAFELVASDGYDLVLVNRVLDRDGSAGLDLIRRLTMDERTRDTPVMLVSDYDDAQDAAVDAGALRGFGKAQIHVAATLDRIADCVGR
jgi:CheY-like chemotaxis protein